MSDFVENLSGTIHKVPTQLRGEGIQTKSIDMLF